MPPSNFRTRSIRPGSRRVATAEELARRLVELSTAASSVGGAEIGRQVAVLIDGVYTNAAHLGSDGPAASGLNLARRLVADLAAGR